VFTLQQPDRKIKDPAGGRCLGRERVSGPEGKAQVHAPKVMYSRTMVIKRAKTPGVASNKSSPKVGGTPEKGHRRSKSQRWFGEWVEDASLKRRRPSDGKRTVGKVNRNSGKEDLVPMARYSLRRETWRNWSPERGSPSSTPKMGGAFCWRGGNRSLYTLYSLKGKSKHFEVRVQDIKSVLLIKRKGRKKEKSHICMPKNSTWQVLLRREKSNPGRSKGELIQK